MTHPFLVGEKVYLRSLSADDIDGPYFGWLNDQTSDVYTSHALWPNYKGKMSSFVDRVNSSNTDLVLAIVDVKKDTHVGNIGLHDISWVHRFATLNILIGEASSRGIGIGREAINLLVTHAFNRLNLHRIQLGVREDNLAAIKAYEAALFREEGRFVDAMFGAGRYYDVIRMSRINES